MRTHTLLAVSCLVFSSLATAHESHEINVEAKTLEAENVAVVGVDEVRSEYGTNEFGDQIIVTHAKLKVKKSLKGKIAETAPEITVEGGTVGDITLEVSDQPKLATGDELLVFLKGKNGARRKLASRAAVMKVEHGQIEGAKTSLEDVESRVRKAQGKK